ncbi:MAG: histone deacetylase, partial [Saprospiraceae bacterium]|nr:histone deacetylase [Saprospiraceae bacterium]
KYRLPEKHRFPMVKYELLPQQLLYEGTITEANLFAPQPISEHWILRTHAATYWEDLKNLTLHPKAARKIGFPLRRDLIERSKVIAQGTIDCAMYARQYGVSLNVAGGTHHSFYDRGEGFCLLNDIAIASNYLLDKGTVRKILVVDLDVHQGNGTAKLFENEPRVFTFSMHGASNYPLRKEKSDLDIGLADGTDDEPYLRILHNYLPLLIEREQPDFIFYLSGVDILLTDKLGRLGLSLQGCKMRDEFVFECCKHYQIPVAVSMGGGYSERVALIVDAHANTYRAAESIFF